MTDLLMTPAEAATYLRLSKSTLDKLRLTGGGPVYAKFGRRFVPDPDAQRILAKTIAPEQPLITDDRYLNLWRDYWARLHADKGQPDGSEAVRLFSELVDFLCDGRDEIIDTLLNWIGYGLFHPAQRLRWSILLISDPKGAGKSLRAPPSPSYLGKDLVRFFISV